MQLRHRRKRSGSIRRSWQWRVGMRAGVGGAGGPGGGCEPPTFPEVFFGLGVQTCFPAIRLPIATIASPVLEREPHIVITQLPEGPCIRTTDTLARENSAIWRNPVPARPITYPAALSGICMVMVTLSRAACVERDRSECGAGILPEEGVVVGAASLFPVEAL